MSARPTLNAVADAVAREHGCTAGLIVSAGSGRDIAPARRDLVWVACRIGWRQADLRRLLRLGSSRICTIAKDADLDLGQPEVEARRGRIMQRLGLGTNAAPVNAGPAPTEPVVDHKMPPAGDARQDRLHELVELFTTVVNRIDARLGQLAAAVTGVDTSVGRLCFLLSMQQASAAQPGGAEPVPPEPDAELLAAAAAAAPGNVPPLATAPLALPPDALIEGEMTATRAARLLRSRDYAPVVEVAPDAWTVGSKRMSTAEMIAMAEALRTRMLSGRKAA